MLRVIIISICLLISPAYASYAQVKTYKVMKYYDNEQQKIREAYYVSDTAKEIAHGPYVSFYTDGTVKIRGHYQNNSPRGIWKYFYENGSLKMIGELSDSFNSGYWRYYYESGQKSMEGSLSGGKREGLWKFYYESGVVKSRGQFKQNVREGLWEYFYEDGVLKAKASYQQGRGVYREYYPTGELKMRGLNILGKSDGLWQFYYPSGELKAKGYYVNGKKDGAWKFYYPSGEISAEGAYEKGKSSGLWKYYHENGNLRSEGLERQGQKEGPWKVYYQTGKLKGEANYSKGTGEYFEYYPSGNLKVEGFKKEGQNEGIWKYFYEDGTLEGVAEFKDGTGLYKGYFKNGNLKMEGMIEDGRRVGKWKLYKRNGDIAGYYTPVYEDGEPGFQEEAADEPEIKGPYEKPEYRFKSKRIKYFTPEVNEYRGVVVATNPILTTIGYLPFSLEYYFQERLGYELLFNIIRKPFFTSDVNVPINEIYTRGYSISIRQKFYQEDKQIGMFYFGHELNYVISDHFVNTIDSTSFLNTRVSRDADEQRIEYGFFIGDRIIKAPDQGGFTLDLFLGVAVGYRIYEENFESQPEISNLFEDVNQSQVSTNFRFGVNIGFMGPVRKSNTLRRYSY